MHTRGISYTWQIIEQINKTYLGYFGHMVRRTGEMEVESKRPRTISPNTWKDKFKEMTENKMHKAIHNIGTYM